MRKKVEHELKDFYFKHSPLEKTGSRRHYAERVVDNWGVRRTISKVQGLCFSSPLYGIYKNPDVSIARGEGTWAGGQIPARLPLLAFDMQKPDEKLDLGALGGVPGWEALREQIAAQPHWCAPTVLPEGFLKSSEDEDEHLDLKEAGIGPEVVK